MTGSHPSEQPGWGHEAPRAGSPLLTDLYELNMVASYLRRGMVAPATFSLFVRRLPPRRGFLVAAGLADCLAYLQELRFDDAELRHLARLGFDDDALDAFSRLRFTGQVRAVPEGRLVFAEEPLLEVTAPLPEAQLVETYLLNQVSFQTALASKAARCVLAAEGRIELVEFGFRRTHGVEAGMAAARAACMVGFAGTSNVEAARRYGLTAMGTMAHSYVEVFSEQAAAFSAFACDLPGRTTFLVDTYDTMGGVADAIAVIKERGLERAAGVRLDSGDLLALAARARALLDQAGLPEVRIFASGGLDEEDVAAMVSSGAPIDAAGIGTRLGVSADAPYLDTAYKVVEYDGRPVAKLSTAKTSYPGAKQVFRGEQLHDHLGLATEPAPAGTRPLLEEVMRGGQRTGPAHGPAELLAAARCRFEADLAALPAAARRLVDPLAPAPALTPALRHLTDTVHAELAARHPATPNGPG
ncbi:MAG TPA: nicotinate phosphoribosyltransferase [Acidimicrobiales bacterium]|nr:nicotinate phosphoribosyltransferase [Acidimicrobiales bacterium]